MALTVADRGRRRQFDPWPGFVDILATLLMVVIFVLMVFVIAQVFLSRALSGRDEALAKLNQQVAQLTDLLALEQQTSEGLRLDLSAIRSQLESSMAARDELQARMTVIIGERDSLASSLADINAQLAQTEEDKAQQQTQITLLLQTAEADAATIAGLREELARAGALAEENKAALLAALADVEQTKKTAADTEASLRAALAQALADVEANRQTAAAAEAALAEAQDEADEAARLSAERQALLDAKLAELEAAFKTIDADREKIQTMLAEIAALQKARDELAKQAMEQQAALAAARSEADEAARLSAEQRAQLEEKLAELESAYKTIAADKEKIDTMLAEIAALEKLRADLVKQVEDSQAALAAARQDSEGAFKTVAEQKAALEARLVDLEAAYKTIDADRAKITALLGDIAALESLRDDLAERLLAREEEVEKTSAELAEERRLSESARLQVDLLNQQVLLLRQQLAQLATALDASEEKAEEQRVQIADLGQRLNAALANKVAELAGYRSEFFGKLRQVLGERPDIQVVGDRFVFQSEVLFDVGSAQIGDAGKQQLAQFADTLLEIAVKIPKDIDWILRVDGHTDRRPIYTAQFRSNWELSAARAIAVVNFLQSRGVPPERLVAAGFAENRPLDSANDEIAYRRNRRIELKLDQR
jgi:chemotaxis protein MotB